jgi:fumarate hydratase class II
MNALIPEVQRLQEAIEAKARAFADVVKIGRTHLQDATPITVGQEFSGWASLLARDIERLRLALPGLYDLAIGGTGRGHRPQLAPGVERARLRQDRRTDQLPFTSHPTKFAALSAHDELVFASGGTQDAGRLADEDRQRHPLARLRARARAWAN